MLDLSIVIIGYKTRGLIKNCLDSIYKNLAESKLNYKLVVVDNNSNDGTIELIHERYPQVELIVMPGNLGYAKAVNRGIKSNAAKYYFVLNPDTLFLQKNSIDKLYRFMENNPRVGLAGPKLVNPDGSIQASCCKFPKFFLPIYRRTRLGKYKKFRKKIDDFLMNNWDHAKTSFVDWVIGTGMFVRHQAIEEIGLMDERFFMYFEDTDWCRRFWRKDWKVCYIADTEVIHYHGRPSLKSGGIRDVFFNKGTRIHISSWLKYFKKYNFKSTDNHNTMDQQKNVEKINPTDDFKFSPQTTEINGGRTAKESKFRGFFWVLIAIVAIVLGYFLVNLIQLNRNVNKAKNSLELAYDLSINFDFGDSNKELDNAMERLMRAGANLKNLKPITWNKNSKENYRASEILINSATQTGELFTIANNWAEQNILPIKHSTDKSITELDDEVKNNFLDALYHVGGTLTDIYSRSQNIQAELEEINIDEINPKIAEKAVSIDTKLSILDDYIIVARDVLPTAVNALGYPKSQTYLFALQNNGEMRPTGGYLGTYGVFQVDNAEFVEFNTYNTHHLDLDNLHRQNELAPEPIRKYLKSGDKYIRTDNWILRDANWSPDLPTSAEKIEELYKLESQDEREFDGLVIMDPTPIVNLLEITGPITVEDITFDAENFVNELEHYTYQGFAQEGVASRDRKELIGELGIKMIDYFLSSNLEKWAVVYNIVNDNLNQKHIMFNFKDADSQEVIAKQNWDNRVKSTAGDYLMVIDSNMGSLKTDRFTDKNIKYSVYRQNDRFVAEVKLTYRNEATASEKTADLRQYTRIYAPIESKLIEVFGTNAKVDTEEELNKTSFGIFWTIPMQESREITLKYELPKRLFLENQYQLYIQKQAGTYNHDFELNFNLDNINEVYQTNLTYDKMFDIRLR